MAEHTKGPWRHATKSNLGNLIEGPTGTGCYDGDDGYRTVCTVQACGAFGGRSEKASKNLAANISLISAAPDMYEALEELRGFVAASNDWRPDSPLARKVRAALAKASGENAQGNG